MKALKCDDCREFYEPYRFQTATRENSDGSRSYLYPSALIGTAPEGQTGRLLDFCRACMLTTLTKALKEQA